MNSLPIGLWLAAATLLSLPSTVGPGEFEKPDGVDVAETSVAVVRIEGDRYMMGYSYGRLFADDIVEVYRIINILFDARGITDTDVRNAVAELFWDVRYDVEPWIEELQGIADGCSLEGHPEIDLDVMKILAAVPDITEHGCSLFAAWGQATVDGATYQMRNLDWAMNTGLEDHVVVVHYRPDDGLEHTVVGLAGIIGASIGGINSAGLAVSEIMGHFCDGEVLTGKPFPFILRDILYHDSTLQAAVGRIENAARTNQYHYAVADPRSPDPKAKLMLTSYYRFDSYVDNESVSPHPCAGLSPFHQPMDDVIYWKNHDGSGNEILHDAIADRYGEIDAGSAVEIARAAGVDSTLVSLVYDNTRREIWIAVADGGIPAHLGSYLRITTPYSGGQLRPREIRGYESMMTTPNPGEGNEHQHNTSTRDQMEIDRSQTVIRTGR